MPLVQIKGIEGYLSLEQKQELIRRVTEAVVAVEGEGVRPVTWVIVEDVPSGAWSVAGQSATTESLRRMAAQTG
jgi:4-oxalocrotonate tautomerase